MKSFRTLLATAILGLALQSRAEETAVFQGLPDAETKATLQWAAYLVQANIPPHYESKKNWGATKRVYAGIDVDNDGLKLKTHRRYRDVRHGKWLKYEIELQEPTNSENLKIEVRRAETLPDGRIAMEVRIESKLDIDARQERWNYGLQLYSVSVRASARVRMTIKATFGIAIDYSRIPPDVLFQPQVDFAELKLIDLEVDQISKLGSDIAEELGDIAERLLRDEYLPKQNEKLAQKLNAQIERQRDKLRISASDWLNQRLSAK